MSTNLKYGHLVLIHAQGKNQENNDVTGQLSALG